MTATPNNSLPGEPGPSADTTDRLAPGVVEIDTLLGGWRQTTAGYLVGDGAPVLVETGSQSSVPTLLAALERLGIGSDDLAGIAVTHIHLDHAGGVGDIARAFPNATVYVHELGARHLVDPTRLVASAARVYGPLLDALYGRLDPTEADRVVVLGDGDSVDVGGSFLRAIDSPGHAKHHLGFLDTASGLLFVGDAVGVRLPGVGVLRPATPPADFNFDQAISSLHRFAALNPTGIALAHFGLVPERPDELLGEAEAALRSWVAIATAAYHEGRDIEAALSAAFANENDRADPEAQRRAETLNGIHANAAGIRRYLETERQDPVGQG